VHGEVVEDDDIALAQDRGELGLDPGVEGGAVDRPSSTQGATSRSARRPAMKVWVPA